MPEITCARCSQTAPQLPAPPAPGPTGLRVWERICAACWQAWLQHQTALINHYGLNLRDAEARRFLTTQMEAFLFAADAADI